MSSDRLPSATLMRTAACVLLLLFWCAGPAGAEEPAKTDGAALPQRPCETLRQAFDRFRLRFCVEHGERLQALAAGQHPGAMVISCCDSRADPALLFDREPGDIFVSRNIGALVPPLGDDAGAGMRAATSYAVDHLHVRDIVILGHTRCGGMNGLAAGFRGTPLEDWLEPARAVLDEARRRLPDAGTSELQAECERLAPVFSARSLMAYPWVADAVAEGRVAVHAWLFDLGTGGLAAWDFERGTWTPLNPADAD